MYNWLNMRAGCRIHSNGIMHVFVDEQFVMVTDEFWEVGDESATSLFPLFSKQQNCTTSMKPCNLVLVLSRTTRSGQSFYLLLK